MKNLGSCSKFLESSKPYFAMISLQFGYAGMNIITKVSLNRGMSHYVLVVYRHAIATAVIAPFALIFERFKSRPIHGFCLVFDHNFHVSSFILTKYLLHFRKMQPRITFPVFMQIFVLALLGLVLAC
jgi:hypothetical protein